MIAARISYPAKFISNVMNAPTASDTPITCDNVETWSFTSFLANALASLLVVAIEMNVVRYIVESQSIVAGPSAANCITEDVEELDDAYLPTTAESTRLRSGSEIHITTVDATKKNIFLNDGSPMNDDDVFVVEVCDDDESLSIVSSLGAADNAIILRCCIGIDLGLLCAEREGRPNGAVRQWFLHCIAD